MEETIESRDPLDILTGVQRYLNNHEHAEWWRNPLECLCRDIVLHCRDIVYHERELVETLQAIKDHGKES